jgi:transcriptional regulator with XRE-family HTH domain
VSEEFIDVGRRIAELRGGLTQVEFAARIGVDRKTVERWEAGKRIPDGSSLLRLRTEFNADVNYILTGVRGGISSASPPPRLAPDEAILLANYRASPPNVQAAIKAASSAGRGAGKKYGA